MTAQTVLLVEDEPSLRTLIKRMLEGAGYEVIEARNGAEGLSCSQDRRVDLVITDVSMPRMDGLSLVDQLALRPNPAPIVVISARRLERRLPSGAMFLRKPFTRDELLDYVRRLTPETTAAPVWHALHAAPEGR